MELPDEILDIIRNEYDNITGLTVKHENSLCYESYFNGYNRQKSIHIASVTKSIFSLLIGIAIDKGFIKNIDQLILDFFPNYQTKRGEKTIQKISLRHLLSMTAPYKFKSEPYTKVYSSNDWTRSVLDFLGGRKFEGKFHYTTIGVQVLSGLLVNATGMSVLDFANNHLFKPLGIESPGSIQLKDKQEHLAFLKNNFKMGWVMDPCNINTAGWGLTLKTMDLLKIGSLCLNKGQFNGETIVSEEWLLNSTKTHSNWNDLSYGLMWWIVDNKQNLKYAAIGDGGNIIYIDESKELVVAITSLFKPRPKDRIEFINSFLLPSLNL